MLVGEEMSTFFGTPGVFYTLITIVLQMADTPQAIIELTSEFLSVSRVFVKDDILNQTMEFLSHHISWIILVVIIRSQNLKMIFFTPDPHLKIIIFKSLSLKTDSLNWTWTRHLTECVLTLQRCKYLMLNTSAWLWYLLSHRHCIVLSGPQSLLGRQK